jgi:hypothetical protein
MMLVLTKDDEQCNIFFVHCSLSVVQRRPLSHNKINKDRAGGKAMHRRLPPRGKSCREHLEDEDDSKGMDALSPAL